MSHPRWKLLESMQIVFAQWWMDGDHEEEEVKQMVDVLGEHFGGKGKPAGSFPLDWVKLESQCSYFFSYMSAMAQGWKKEVEGCTEDAQSSGSDCSSSGGEEEDAEEEEGVKEGDLSTTSDVVLDAQGAMSAAARTAQAWRDIEGDVMHSGSMSEIIKLAKLVFTMSPGSVDEERMFSTMKFIKSPLRNRLKADHLTCCARLFMCRDFSLASFPYADAARHWALRSKRTRYMLGALAGDATDV
jgi:hypothetical protein